MKPFLKAVLAAMFGVGFLATAYGDSISITNASFEAPTTTSLVEGTAATGWTNVTVSGIGSQYGAGYIRNGCGYNPPNAVDGTQMALLKGAGGMYQSISGFTVGQTYTITFYAAGRYFNQNSTYFNTNSFRVLMGDTLADASALTFTVSGSSTTTLTPGTATSTSGSWTTYTTTFTATSSTEVLEFLSTLTSSTNGDYSTYLDNVSIAAVPEPSTTALSIMTAGGLAAYTWRKRRKKWWIVKRR